MAERGIIINQTRKFSCTRSTIKVCGMYQLVGICIGVRYNNNNVNNIILTQQPYYNICKYATRKGDKKTVGISSHYQWLNVLKSFSVGRWRRGEQIIRRHVVVIVSYTQLSGWMKTISYNTRGVPSIHKRNLIVSIPFYSRHKCTYLPAVIKYSRKSVFFFFYV